MVEQSGESFLLPFPCCLPHTVQSLGHALPALCRTHVRLNDVLLSLRPSLPSFRGSLRFSVRLVHWFLWSTLHETPHGAPCKTRGQDGVAVLLSCRALSSPTTCRFIPAHSGLPTNPPGRVVCYCTSITLRRYPPGGVSRTCLKSLIFSRYT